jgi:hypothetical protein
MIHHVPSNSRELDWLALIVELDALRLGATYAARSFAALNRSCIGVFIHHQIRHEANGPRPCAPTCAR